MPSCGGLLPALPRGRRLRLYCAMATLPLTTPTVVPDAALLRRMAQHDATALVELQRRYGGSLYALVYGILIDRKSVV